MFHVWSPAIFRSLPTRKGTVDVAKAQQPGLLDMVAVLNSADDSAIHRGDVGTIVEVLPPDGVEVEFLGRDGRTRYVGTLTTGDVLVLNRERTCVA